MLTCSRHSTMGAPQRTFLFFDRTLYSTGGPAVPARKARAVLKGPAHQKPRLSEIRAFSKTDPEARPGLGGTESSCHGPGCVWLNADIYVNMRSCMQYLCGLMYTCTYIICAIYIYVDMCMYAMLCCAVLYYVALSYVMLCHMSCCVLLLRYVMLCHAML